MNPIFDALSLLTPYDIDKPKVRIGPAHDGGYVLVDNITPDQTIISYGISVQYQFDAEMAVRGHQVFMFDHTIQSINQTNENMRFYREGVGGASSADGTIYSIEDHLAKYGICSDRMILKMDVEGAEWEAILSTPDNILRRFEQITIEVHGFESLEDANFRDKFVRFFRKLNRNFTLFHVHGNNCDGPNTLHVVGGIPVSALMELSYVRTDTINRSASKTLYPTAYDYPCVGQKDKLLWFYPYLPANISLADFALCSDRVEIWHQFHMEFAQNRGLPA